MSQKSTDILRSLLFFLYLFIVWGSYRYFVDLPDAVDEVLVKPLLWIIPVYLLIKKEKSNWASVGITGERFFPVTYLILGLGTVFALEALLINYFKYGGLELIATVGDSGLFSAFLLSIATAIPEELAFRGYIFTRLWRGLNNEWLANIITAMLWAIIHLPIAIFVWHYDTYSLTLFMTLLIVFSIGAAYIFARTKNIISSISLHILWQWPIILFR